MERGSLSFTSKTKVLSLPRNAQAAHADPRAQLVRAAGEMDGQMCKIQMFDTRLSF